MTFSYSSISTYNTCPYSFYLTYIENKPRINNFFAEYGLLTHQCFEEFFNRRLEAYELSKFYEDNYYVFCQTSPPPYPSGMEENYKNQGKEFFDNFSFDLSKYNIIGIENTLKFKISDKNFSGRPDLILQNKDSGENILVDYKSSIVFRKNKRTGVRYTDDKKLEGYYKQMHLYSYGIRKDLGLQIDKIMIWFTRPEIRHVIDWKKKKEEQTIKWVQQTLEKIFKDEKFKYDNSQEYFCNNICSVREDCRYRNNRMG
jgi:hypothetical protein